MQTKFFHVSFLLVSALAFLASCQKEVDGTITGVVTPVNQFPKVGTTWTYRYEWYNTPGGATNTKTIYHKAIKDTLLGGDTWLKIIDVETDTTVYYLKTKTDGLYQYTNNNAYLLCKYPAAVNDTYSSFNEGAMEDFTVRGINDSLATGIGIIPLSKYEGVKVGDIIHLLWFNKYAWIAWKIQYKRVPVPPTSAYYLYSRMYIDNIVY